MTDNQIQLYTSTDEAKQLVSSSGTLVAQARAVLVVDDASLTAATEFLTTVKQQLKHVEAEKEKLYRPAKQALDAISELFKSTLTKLEDAEKALKATIGTYQMEQKRIADAKAAEEKRLRDEAILKAQQEQERQQREQEAAVRAQAAEAAARLEAEGKAEQAAAVQAQAEAVLEDIKQENEATTLAMIENTTSITAAHEATTRTSSGMATTRMVWTAEVVDVSQLPAEYLLPNTAAINAAVRAGVREIAGVRIYEKPSVSVRVA